MGLFLHSISSFFFKRGEIGVLQGYGFFIHFFWYIYFFVYIFIGMHFQISDIGQSLCVASAELSWSQNAFFNMWFMKSHGKRQTKKKILEKKKKPTHYWDLTKNWGKNCYFREFKTNMKFHSTDQMIWCISNWINIFFGHKTW